MFNHRRESEVFQCCDQDSNDLCKRYRIQSGVVYLSKPGIQLHSNIQPSGVIATCEACESLLFRELFLMTSSSREGRIFLMIFGEGRTYLLSKD